YGFTIPVVHGKHVIVPVQMLGSELLAVVVDGYAVFSRVAYRPFVGGLTYVIIGGPGRIRRQNILQATRFHFMLKDGLCQGRPANIPEAHKHNFCHWYSVS